jgi:GAF domain-containing protein
MADNTYDTRTADRFARLASELHDIESVHETVDGVVDFALHAINCTHAGIALVRARRPQNTATDPLVQRLYEHQLERRCGPMMAAFRERQVVLVRDTVTDPRWPEWSRLAGELGVRTVMHLPLQVGERTVGVLSLYHDAADAFSADDEAVAHILARHASVAVAAARKRTDLTEAVDSRKLVGQAMGILMERYDLDDTRAFAVLKRYSQSTNTKLREVALELVSSRGLPEQQP